MTNSGDMPLVPVTVELILLHRNKCYVILVNVIQSLMCFNDWCSTSITHEVQHLRPTCECRSPTYCMDSSQWRCRNHSWGTSAVEKLIQSCKKIGTTPTDGPWSTSWWPISSIPLTQEVHVWFQTTVLYGCNSENGYTNTMSSFYTTFCWQTTHVLLHITVFRSPQQSPLGMG
jgi:hypothetical protein